MNEMNFDSERALRLRSTIVEVFRARARGMERRMFAWLLICVGFAAFFARRFFASSDVQAWIAYGVGFLVMFEFTILFKLWYWVVNSKLGILREVKLLRSDLAINRGSLDSLEASGEIDSPIRVPGLSKRERFAWIAAVMLVWIVMWGESMGRSGIMCSNRAITLHADGAGRMETLYELQNTTPRAIREFTIYSGGEVSAMRLIPLSESMYADSWGRQLAVRQEPAGLNHRDVVQLIEPVSAGQHFWLKTTGEARAQRQGDNWKFSMSQNWGYRHNEFHDTVTLPKGASVISAEPSPESQETKDGVPVLRFSAERDRDQVWSYTVIYSVSEAATNPAESGGHTATPAGR